MRVTDFTCLIVDFNFNRFCFRKATAAQQLDIQSPALSFGIFLWSAMTCHRFLFRLVIWFGRRCL